MKGNLKRPDFCELMNPLLRTTAGILFFSLVLLSFGVCYHSLYFPGNSLFPEMCQRTEGEKTMGTDRTVQGMSSGSCQFAQNRIRRGKCFLGEQRRYSSAFWRTICNVW